MQGAEQQARRDTSEALGSPSSACFVCGQDHPTGMRIRFQADGEAVVRATWRSSEAWTGLHGAVHGGILSTLLDEAMSKAIQGMGWRALTCDLRVRLKKSVSPGETVEVRGWVKERRKRRVEAEATLHGEDGQERARATAVFLILERGG